MPFHVEISQGFRRARAFNLDETKLRAQILDPWTRGRLITLGDRDWEPRDCKLIVLEGAELSDTDLSMGRGWSNAERVSENVTRRLADVAAPPAGHPLVVVLAESDATGLAVTLALDGLGLETAPWSELRARILGPRRDGRGPGYAAVLAIDSPSPSPVSQPGRGRVRRGGRTCAGSVRRPCRDGGPDVGEARVIIARAVTGRTGRRRRDRNEP